jgi:transposase
VRAPSAKTLLSELRQLSPDDARLIRALAGAAADGDKLRKLIDARVPATAGYVRSMYSDPYRSQFWRNTVALHAMNEVLGTHGVEGLGPRRSGDYAPSYEYLNAGDPYVGTLIYDRDRDRLFVGSWGDFVEKHPEWESREEHATIRRGSVLSKSPAQLDHEISRALSAHRERR